MFEHRMRSFAVPIPKVQHSFWVNLIYPSVRRDNQAESIALIELATICGQVMHFLVPMFSLIPVVALFSFYLPWLIDFSMECGLSHH